MKKITPEYLETLIKSETYSNTGKTTVCILTLHNGFEIVCSSGIVDVSQFDEELGNKYAREAAINALWQLEGYRLQWTLAIQDKTNERPVVTVYGDMREINMDVFNEVKKAATVLDDAGFKVYVTNFYINGEVKMPIEFISVDPTIEGGTLKRN